MTSKLTSTQVTAWLAEVQDELRQVRDKLQPLVDEERRLEEREELLRSLLASFSARPLSEGSERSASGSSDKRNGSVRDYVVSRAVDILRDEGRPMHINDLHARFIERGYTIPGKGRPVNLIVHLKKSDAVGSPQRGIYGLAENVGEVNAPPKRKRPSTRRRKR